MKQLPRILALYREIDAALEQQLADAEAQSDFAAMTRVVGKQSLNDQAYFILAWGQLEAEINETCREVIRGRHNSAQWTDRRLWELFNPDDRRLSGLSFHERAAIVLQRDSEGRAYQRAIRHYDARNGIAHGALQTDRIELVAVINDFYLIQAELRA